MCANAMSDFFRVRLAKESCVSALVAIDLSRLPEVARDVSIVCALLRLGEHGRRGGVLPSVLLGGL